MNDEVSQIKERLDIVEVVSSYLTLKRAGANMKANCPFHQEKTPSFMINSERQTFKCFGCGEGGDIFTFIEKMEGVDFYNALKILADKAGVVLQKNSFKRGEAEFKADKKTRIFEINDWAKKLFHKILIDHPKANKAREYLKKRGMTDKTINEFEIGYAPDSWDLLTKFLRQKKYTDEEMISAGIAIRGERGTVYDRFRGRIMFPINNIMGLTVAFTSRVLIDDQNQAKYINSSESPVYTKGKTIYGLDKAKMAIKEADLAIFVEGNMDVIACHQAGFKNVVATSGTAITEDQLKILSRYTSEIAFCFDSDTAGEAAMKKAVQLALKNDINSKIIAMPEPFKDPDEAISADPKNWQRAIELAKPALEFWIDLLIRKNPSLDISIKKKIAKEILPVVKTIFSPIEKEYYLKYLAKKLSVAEKVLADVLDKTKSEVKRDDSEKDKTKSVNLNITEKIIGLLWSEPKLIKKFEAKAMKLLDKKYEKFITIIKSSTLGDKNINEDDLSFLNQLAMSATKDIDEVSDENLENELKVLFGHKEADQKEKIKTDFAEKIQEAEASGDKEKLKKLLAEFSELLK